MKKSILAVSMVLAMGMTQVGFSKSSTWVYCAKQGEVCDFKGGAADVKYGAVPGGSTAPAWIMKEGWKGGFTCDDETFGGDPFSDSSITKECYYIQ